ncbi:MAG: LysM peptidoglycan-binding domain-containing protein [Lacunisphaera sp.]
MKILQIFGAVVAIHLLAFIFIFASPGCQSGPPTPPTPDATMPAAVPEAPISYAPANVSPQPVDLGTPAVMYNPASPSGHAAPTRPGSANAVAITPAKPAENVAPVSTYTVERGDSLWSIAKKHGLTVSELAKANSVTTGTALKPGRKLIIPGKVVAATPVETATTASAEKAPTATASHAAGAEVVKHTVQSGESLGVIARKYGVTVGELAAANNITDPSKVRIGQQLVIPGAKATGNKGTATVSNKSAPASKSTTAAAKPAAGSTSATTEAAKPAEPAPHFDLTPPPPGQDLDAGLKEGATDVPTIKVEEPAPTPPTTN